MGGISQEIMKNQPNKGLANKWKRMSVDTFAEAPKSGGMPDYLDAVFNIKPSTTPQERAQDTYAMTYQQILDEKKQQLEQKRTDAARMAKYNAFGNLLTSMVQPLGWAVGGQGVGVTGNTQPYDSRAYLDAFNRAVQANDELRNIGSGENDLAFKMANEEYQRERAWEDYKRKADYQAQHNSAYASQRFEEEMKKITARSEARMAENKDKAEYALDRIRLRSQLKLKSGGKPVPKSDQEKFEAQVMKDWLSIMKDYDKNVANGMAPATPPPEFEDFYNQRAESAGYEIKQTGSGNAGGVSTQTGTPSSPSTGSGTNTNGGGSGSNSGNQSKQTKHVGW